jgi:hypothetical protein
MFALSKPSLTLLIKYGGGTAVVVVRGVRVRETFELNQLKSALHNFYRFFQDLTGCKLVAISVNQPISYIFFQVPDDFFFIVMTTGQELG